jgi:YidC/Oxa1 family membrane protein insertase
VGPTALIAFMMKLDTDVAVMTTPDLETFHIKRSLVRDDTEYIYTDHGISSLHLCFREQAFDNFDTLFCDGPNQVAEARRLEELHQLPGKQLVEAGFGLMDNLLENVAALPKAANDPPLALIAPSWQKDNLMELCLPEIVHPLLACGFAVVVRPHPEFVKRFGPQLDSIIAHFAATEAEALDSGRLQFETDFSSNRNIYSADVVVTDWSTIAQEFSFCTRRPSIFVNTPMKVMNPNWEQVGLKPLEIAQRSRIGVALDIEELDGIGQTARGLLAEREQWDERIAGVLKETLFNIGHSAEVGGRYILDVLAEYEQVRSGL